MSHLDSTEKARITDAIRNAEARTDGELVTVITHSSDDYLYIPTLFAALLALGVAGLLIVFHPSFSASEIYLTQVAVFFRGGGHLPLGTTENGPYSQKREALKSLSQGP